MNFFKSPKEQISISQIATIYDSKVLKSLDNRRKRATFSSTLFELHSACFAILQFKHHTQGMADDCMTVEEDANSCDEEIDSEEI